MTGVCICHVSPYCALFSRFVLPLWFELLCYKCFLSHRSVVFVYPPTTPVHLPCLWTHSVRSSFLSLLSLDHSGAASGIILLKVWLFAAFVDVVLVSSNWIDLELKNSHSASSCSARSRGQRLSFNLLPTHCGSFRLLLFPRVQRTASITQLLPTHCGQCAAPGCLR